MNKKKAVFLFVVLLAGLIVFAYQRGDNSAYSSTFICFLFGMLLSYYMIHRNELPPPVLFFAKIILFILISWLYYNQFNLDLKINLIAVLIVFLVIISPIAQKILSNRISVFLGKISFPLYCIHMTVICSLTSFLITKEYNPNNTKMIILYIIITSILSACILYPVEKFAIILSGRIYEYLSTDNKVNFQCSIGKMKNKKKE